MPMWRWVIARSSLAGSGQDLRIKEVSQRRKEVKKEGAIKRSVE